MYRPESDFPFSALTIESPSNPAEAHSMTSKVLWIMAQLLNFYCHINRCASVIMNGSYTPENFPRQMSPVADWVKITSVLWLQFVHEHAVDFSQLDEIDQ